ncbi:MAG: hypothetical protein ACE5EU_07760, partial [Paracoccaceae bacterium]
MIPRSLTPGLCAVALLVAYPASAGNVNECSMVAEGRSKLISFDAQMADSTGVELTGILTDPA